MEEALYVLVSVDDRETGLAGVDTADAAAGELDAVEGEAGGFATGDVTGDAGTMEDGEVRAVAGILRVPEK
jgi:hypothetical protein